MLAHIGLSPDALLDISAQKGGKFGSRLAWEALSEVLRSHGSLLLSSREEMARFIDILRGTDLTVDEKKRLTALITKLKKENRIDTANPPLSGPLSRVQTSKDIEELHKMLPLIAVVPGDTFVRLFPENNEGLAHIRDGAEVTVGETVSQATQLQKLQELAQAQNFSSGTAREKVWDDLFASLAARFPRVSVLDRYVLTELVNRESRGTSAQFKAPEHLVWFLSRLDYISPPGTRVTIYAQLENPRADGYGPIDADSALDLIDRHWAPLEDGRIETIEVCGVQWRAKTHPHNRHIRFGDSLGFKLDEGLDRLAHPTIAYDSGFSYSYAWRPEHVRKMREDESLIRNSADMSWAEWKIKD